MRRMFYQKNEKCNIYSPFENIKILSKTPFRNTPLETAVKWAFYKTPSNFKITPSNFKITLSNFLLTQHF